MKWIYSIKHKMAAALLLLAILMVTLFNNLNERNSSSEINRAIEELYKDRLIPESYLFQYADYLHRVIEITDHATYTPLQKQQDISNVMIEMQGLHHNYMSTKLTNSEAIHFKGFIDMCGNISKQSRLGDFSKSWYHAMEATMELKALSAIQLSEAKMLMAQAKQLFVSGKMFSQFEVAMLIIIAVVIQGLVFASRTLQENFKQQHPHLN